MKPTKRVMHLDIETTSELDLLKVGADTYSLEPSTKIVLLSAAYDDEPHPVQIDFTQDAQIPKWLVADLIDPNVRKLAWNAAFEFLLISRCWWVDLDLTQWWCVMAMARSLSFPGSLGDAGGAMRLPIDKRKFADGKRLINKFCKPHPCSKKCPSGWWTPEMAPEEWLRFKEYNRQDTLAERDIFHTIRKFLPLTQTPFERKIWLLDHKINQTGMPIDRALVDGALKVHEGFQREMFRRMSVITGLDNPNSVPQMRDWIEQHNVFMPSMTKDVVRDTLLRKDIPSDVRDVLGMWQQTSKASIKKFHAFRDGTGQGDRLRGAFAYYGAQRTGRWSGKDVQPQNLTGSVLGGDTLEEMQARLALAIQTIKQGDWKLLDLMYPSVTAALTSTVRCSIAAPRGKKLNVADLSSIETVVIGWASKCERILNLFREGKDAYKDYATFVFGVAYEEVTKQMRKWSKPPVLGCGFMLGGDGLVAYAAGMGVNLAEMFTDEDWSNLPELESWEGEYAEEHRARAVGKRLVNVYRDAYPQVKTLWYALKAAAMKAVREQTTVECWPVIYEYRKPFLFCHLPSGRALSYFDPKLEIRKHPKFGDIEALTYMGVHQKTRRWDRLATHPGKLTENIVQAMARDILAQGLLNAEAAGFEIIGHVHDEIITLADVGSDLGKKELIACMTDLPHWAKGMPVGAAGWEGQFYLKD